MAYQQVLELVLLENGIVDIEHCAAGIAEHMFNALLGQAADDDVCAGKFLGHATSFQGPLEIDRMLSPGETDVDAVLGHSFIVR
jgi:hypothetical protein